MKINIKLEYCFAREKEIVFAQQKQSAPMSINQFVEIQNGDQKWRENDFWEKSPVDSADNLRVKNLVENALSRSISMINGFLCLTQKFKMATKIGGIMNFAKCHQ